MSGGFFHHVVCGDVSVVCVYRVCIDNDLTVRALFEFESSCVRALGAEDRLKTHKTIINEYILSIQCT